MRFLGNFVTKRNILKNVANCTQSTRHAELVSASVDFRISTLSELVGKIRHNTDAETSSA